MIEFCSEVLPDRRTVTGRPPRRERKAQHVQHAQNRSEADKHSENQTDPNEKFNNANQVTKEDDMRKNYMAEHRPIKAYCRLLNIPFEIMREPSVRERASENFVFSKQHEENSSTDARDEQNF